MSSAQPVSESSTATAAAAAAPATDDGSPAAAATATTGAANPASNFLHQRLAAVAALPPEQRSHDEVGFLRAHELLTEAQERIAALGSSAAGGGELSAGEQDAHTSVAALAFVGGLEQLCTIGVPLQLAMQLHSSLGLALLKRVPALQQRISEASAQVALRFLHIVSTLVQFVVQTVALHEETPVDVRLPPDAIREPAALLRQEQAQLFNPLLSCGYELVLHGLQQTTLCQLPSLAQLRHLWAQLCWEWTAQLAEGMRPSWMSAYPGPTRDEARQLQLQALAAMRNLRPSHPLTAGRAVFTRFAGALPGPSGFDLVCSGLQQAAAAGGPHGSSMLTAEFAFGKICISAPTADTPPWGRLSLAQSVQLLQQADAALARCKALLPPAYLSGLKLLRSSASVRWRRAAVERHQQAGAEEWREDLLAAEAAPPIPPGRVFASRRVRTMGGECACCGSSQIELRTCSGCKLAKYCSKQCQVKHWPEHKAQCRAASEGAGAQQQEQQGAKAREGGRRG